MSHALARIAIEKKLQQWAKTKSYKIVFGVMQSVPTLPVYMKGFNLPASTRSLYLAYSGLDFIGLYQVSIVCDPATDISVPEKYVKELTELFPVDSEIAESEFNGTIMEPVAQGPTLTEKSSYTIPATIFYRGKTDLIN